MHISQDTMHLTILYSNLSTHDLQSFNAPLTVPTSTYLV